MAWIKRNLFFTIGGVIALILLGAAGYYDFKAWGQNSDSMATLSQAYSDLAKDYSEPISPNNQHPNNIDVAHDQEKQLRAWVGQARKYFEGIPPIPNPPDGVVKDQQFAGTLRETILDLQKEATNDNVALPPDYAFSFAAERNLVTFSPGSLNLLAERLGEVKALSDILFDAKINALVQIQRENVSDNDTAGPQADFLSDKTSTIGDGLATVTPYSVTFRCFSADLANVLSKLASSNHCFIVGGINVMPAEAMAEGADQPPPPTTLMPMPGGGLPTVLDEKLLQVTLAIEVVKLKP
jgi:hypothetical protein